MSLTRSCFVISSHRAVRRTDKDRVRGIRIHPLTGADIVDDVEDPGNGHGHGDHSQEQKNEAHGNKCSTPCVDPVMENLFGREPALVLGAANALLALAVGFGLQISPEQVGLINAAVAAILSVVVRSQVTPVN